MADFSFFGLTDPGLVRKKNEDSVLVDQKKGVCLVADGIGGAFGGDIASQIFAETARNVFQNNSIPPFTGSELIKGIFQTANDTILAYSKADPSYKGMGCTAELIYLSGQTFVLGHLGDSRTYRLRQNTLEQLTTDHTLVQEQLDQGVITAEDALNHSFKNVISKAVGIQKDPIVDLLHGRIVPGDIFLLCSDGLNSMIDDPVIKSHLLSDVGIDKKAQRLIQAANDAGGKDNISVVLAESLG